MYSYKCRCGYSEETCLLYSKKQLSCKKCGKQLKYKTNGAEYPRVPWKGLVTEGDKH